MNWKVVAGVCGAWIVAALVLSGQNALHVAMGGGTPTPWYISFVQTLPWASVTLGGIAMAQRAFPSRAQWVLQTAAHVAAVFVLSFVANVLIVLGYMAVSGNFAAPGEILRQSALWTVLNLHIAGVIYAATVGATRAVLYFRRSRAHELQLVKLEGQLVRARLETLNSQIRPHFLFNTLHTIGQLWRSGRSDDADAVLDHLGSLFHKVHNSTSQFEVPLSEELEMVRAYLAIEETRFRDRLRTSVSATDDALKCHVPPLILQPLVENAIRHGISAVSSASRVSVSATVVGEQLRLMVCDDGPGMSAISPQPGSGTGLRNTRERLAQLYGNAAQVVIDKTVNGGASVRLDLPVSDGSSGRRLNG